MSEPPPLEGTPIRNFRETVDVGRENSFPFRRLRRPILNHCNKIKVIQIKVVILVLPLNITYRKVNSLTIYFKEEFYLHKRKIL